MVVVLWGCRWGWCEGGGGSGCDDEDGVGGVVMKVSCGSGGDGGVGASVVVEWRGSGYQQKDRKPSQNDKTEHGMEKTVQNQGQSPKMSKSETILKKSAFKPWN
ncbi:hypothetical protein Tco_1326819 [Tanacetum coccineum]